MDKLREKITLRGTQDCPFQQYNIKCALPTYLTSIHWHPEYEIIYLKTGSVELKYDKHSCVLFSNEIAFIQPEWLHSIKTLEENTSYFAFVFSLELLTLPPSHFFQKEVIEPIAEGTHQFIPLLRKGDPQHGKVKIILDELVQCSKNAPNRKAVVFTSMVQIFLQMAETIQPCSIQKKHNNETVKTALQYMTDHYSERITLQQIADSVHLHPNYLCALFKEYTGQTAFYHLNRIRVENAANLLKNSALSVSDAASCCGFDNTGFFTRKFKEYMGMPPKEYSIRHR